MLAGVTLKTPMELGPALAELVAYDVEAISFRVEHQLAAKDSDVYAKTMGYRFADPWDGSGDLRSVDGDYWQLLISDLQASISMTLEAAPVDSETLHAYQSWYASVLPLDGCWEFTNCPAVADVIDFEVIGSAQALEALRASPIIGDVFVYSQHATAWQSDFAHRISASLLWPPAVNAASDLPANHLSAERNHDYPAETWIHYAPRGLEVTWGRFRDPRCHDPSKDIYRTMRSAFRWLDDTNLSVYHGEQNWCYTHTIFLHKTGSRYNPGSWMNQNPAVIELPIVPYPLAVPDVKFWSCSLPDCFLDIAPLSSIVEEYAVISTRPELFKSGRLYHVSFYKYLDEPWQINGTGGRDLDDGYLVAGLEVKTFNGHLCRGWMCGQQDHANTYYKAAACNGYTMNPVPNPPLGTKDGSFGYLLRYATIGPPDACETNNHGVLQCAYSCLP